MSHHSDSLATLIGSRICHDLISPIGAITNGLELLELSGAAQGPELALVAQSVADARARIQLFRLAFGVASEGQMTGGDEVGKILAETYKDSRISIGTFPEGDHPRDIVRAVLLAILCAEQAIPYGGMIDITHSDSGWCVIAQGERIVPDPDHWAALAGGQAPATAGPSAVHFALLPGTLADLNMNCTVELTDTKAEIRLNPA